MSPGARRKAAPDARHKSTTRTLDIVDDYTRECVAIEVDRSLQVRARYRFDRSRTEWTQQLDGEIVAHVNTDGNVSEIDLKAIVRLNPPLRRDSSAS